MENQYSVFPDIHFDRRARQVSYRHGCRTLRNVSYILFQIILVLSTRSASAASPLTWDQGKAEESRDGVDRNGVGNGQDVNAGPRANLGIWEASKVSKGETGGDLQSAQGPANAVGQMRGSGTGHPSVNRSPASQKKPQGSLPPTLWWLPPSHVPVNTSAGDPLRGRGANLVETAFRGSRGYGHSLKKPPVNAGGGQQFVSSPEKLRGTSRPVVVPLPTKDIREPSMVTYERPLYARAPPRRGPTPRLHSLPPMRGKKSLAAAGLLYLMGWMSLPWALSMAGLGVYKILRSQAKREKALIEALRHAEGRDTLDPYTFP